MPGSQQEGTISPEYSLEVDDKSREVSCWIPSQVGQSFSICWKKTSRITGSQGTSGDVYIDGLHAGGRIIRKKALVHVELSELITSATTTRPFVFASVELTDDDAYLFTSARDIGEVRLEIHEAVIGKIGATKQINDVPIEEKIHERAKKSMTHRVKFAEARPSDYQHQAVSVTRKERIVTFVFKYRSFEVLQANGLTTITDTLNRSESADTKGIVKTEEKGTTLQAASLTSQPGKRTIGEATERSEDIKRIKLESIADSFGTAPTGARAVVKSNSSNSNPTKRVKKEHD